MERYQVKLSLGSLKISFRLGGLLAYRQITRSSWWTNILIIFVMTLTYLNLVVVSGILVGLIEGASTAVRHRYTSDVIVSNLKFKEYIQQSSRIIKAAEGLPQVEAVTARYVIGGAVEANYKNRLRETDLIESAGTLIAGIDPETENRVTGLSEIIVEGDYLAPDDYDQVILGSSLLNQYLPIDSPGFITLTNVGIGSKVRLVIGDITREVSVKGITKSKVDEVDRRVFMVASQLRGLIDRYDYNVDEIAIKAVDPSKASTIRDALIGQGFADYAKIQTWEDAQPKFLKDIKDTFALLGNVISSIGLTVAAITIFIVIFINAITHRKYIGILKGIGVTGSTIEIAYILQSLFYAILGTTLGIGLVFLIIKPYLLAHPINFPFSDGILVATVSGTLWRAAILFAATMVAGYIPAKLVVRQNTLDAILGR